MQGEHDLVESVDETLHFGNISIEESRRLIDVIDLRLSRGSEILGVTTDGEHAESD